MKALRIWLLLVLAVLLPVRGAVAAAMLCQVAGSGVQFEVSAFDHPVGHEEMDHATPHDHGGNHEHGHDDASGGSHDHRDHADSDKCNACSAYCSLTPLVSSVPTLPEPPGLTAVKFCDHCAPAPSFLSGGQERPPRTI